MNVRDCLAETYEKPTLSALGQVAALTLNKTSGEDDEPWNVTLIWDNIPPVRPTEDEQTV